MRQFSRSRSALCLALTIAIGAVCVGAPRAGQTTDLPADIRAAVIKTYVTEGMETRYVDGTVDLNGDGRAEHLVHVVGPMACGSGGCPTLVFTPEGTGYRLLSTIGPSRTPIRAAAVKNEGWRNLIVHIAGGGASAGDVELLFNGTSYPANPTVTGRHVRRTTMTGDLVIPDFESFDKAKPIKSPGTN